MAFQTGTKVDPRLMRADLSGFSRGTELAMAGIASAVSGYAKKKKEKQEIDLATEAFIGAAEGNPYLRGLFPEGELTSDNVKKAVKGVGAKNMMNLLVQTNLLQTKGDVEGSSLKRQKQDLKGLGELLKAQGISDTGGQLEFDLPRKTKFSTGSGTRFGLEDTMTDPRLATLFETYGPLLQAQYPEQFGGVSASATQNTYTEPTKVRDNVGTDYTGFGYLGLEK